MIPVIIFYIHMVFLIYVVTKNYVEGNIVQAILSMIFIIIIFSVGWTISEFLMSLIMEPEGVSILLPRYAFSLTFLSIIEFIFYKYFYFKKNPKTKVGLT